VSYPDLPEPFDPEPDEWLAVLREELATMDGERIVLCHSLSCLLWLLHARDGAANLADRVLMVAPPCRWDIPQVARFRPDGVTADDLRRAAAVTRMLCAEPDPYCPAGAATTYGHSLELDFELIPGGGHLNTDAGFGPWPEVEEWALRGQAA
jgi:predicted alpha/beta hydrolase family esterase